MISNFYNYRYIVMMDSGINTISTAHMAAQIRVKQLATKESQDLLLVAIRKVLELGQDKSGQEIVAEIEKTLLFQLELVREVNAKLAPKDITAQVGYPIKFNKTALQLEMALDWVRRRGEDLIVDFENGVLYNGLSNDVAADQLPVLKAPSETTFWGNENSSVSTVLLYSVANTFGCNVSLETIVAAGTFYPYLSPEYSVDVVENPFVSHKGMILFGDYQFGGHRYFSDQQHKLGQQLFAPEDCSSAVGKATGLNEEQIVGIYTGRLRDAYTDQANEYGYQAVVSSLPDETFKFDLISPGDIYVRGGHTTIISGKNNAGIITTFGFNRDIDAAKGKMLGGGVFPYDLSDVSEGKPIYILKSSNAFKETASLPDFLTRVDTKYRQFCDEGNKKDAPGDCDIFLR